MRIAIVSEHASPLAVRDGVAPGGRDLHVARLAAAVAGRGHEVRVYTRRTSDVLPSKVDLRPGVTVVHVPAGPPSPVAGNQLLPYLQPFGHWLATAWRGDGWAPDVIHAHHWMSGVAALAATDTVPRPIVQTFHGLGSVRRRHQGSHDPSPPSRVALERAVGRYADRIVAQSADEVDELLRLRLPRQRISVIPSGVDVDAFTPIGPEVPRSPRRSRILAVGRLVERKGFTDLIEALPHVPDAELVIVGGPLRSDLDRDPAARRLREVAGVAGVSGRVRLTGAVAPADMPRWYRSADVLVCAPRYEPAGLTALEGMACGAPVVATAVGGLTDTVVDGVTGELVAPRDPAALGKAVRQLLASRTRRLAYGSAGVDRVRCCYAWPGTAERLVGVYREVSGISSPAARA